MRRKSKIRQQCLSKKNKKNNLLHCSQLYSTVLSTLQERWTLRATQQAWSMWHGDEFWHLDIVHPGYPPRELWGMCNDYRKSEPCFNCWIPSWGVVWFYQRAWLCLCVPPVGGLAQPQFGFRSSATGRDSCRSSCSPQHLSPCWPQSPTLSVMVATGCVFSRAVRVQLTTNCFWTGLDCLDCLRTSQLESGDGCGGRGWKFCDVRS